MENFQVIFVDPYLAILSKREGVAIQSDDFFIHPEIAQLFPNKSLYLVNRIDQPVSGLFIVAFSQEMERVIRNLWESKQVEKLYIALSQNNIAENGTLNHHLIKQGNKAKVVQPPQGKFSSLSFIQFAKSNAYFGYLIQLKTGRFHQIRAQLAYAGAPIKGDLKYGAKRSNPGGGISLHAYQIKFIHPISNVELKVTSPPPQDNLWDFFTALLPESVAWPIDNQGSIEI